MRRAETPSARIDDRARTDVQSRVGVFLDPSPDRRGTPRQPDVIDSQPAHVCRLGQLHAQIGLRLPGGKIRTIENADAEPVGESGGPRPRFAGRSRVDQQNFDSFGWLARDRGKRRFDPLLPAVGGDHDAEPDRSARHDQSGTGAGTRLPAAKNPSRASGEKLADQNERCAMYPGQRIPMTSASE